MIYMDAAATSYHKPKAVAEAVCRAVLGTGSSGRGEHVASLDASRTLYQTRKVITDLFGAESPSNVVFTYNATQSLNTALMGLLEKGDHCITTQAEHNSVLRPLYHLQKLGVELSIVPLRENGVIRPEDIEKALKPNTRMIAVTHASNVTGNVTDIHAISDICKKNNLFFILDASQSAGLVPVNICELEISALCCSGHKGLLAPQGIGLLVLGKQVDVKPLLYGGTGVDSYSPGMPDELPTRLEAGTINVHGAAGLLAGCTYILTKGQENLLKSALELSYRFYKGIKDCKGVTVYGDFSSSLRTPVVSLNICDEDAGTAADDLLQRFQIAVRAGAHCAPLVHRFFKTEEQGMVRFSFSHFNTIEETDIAIQAVKTLAEEYR